MDRFEFKAGRRQLNLSQNQLAALFQVSSGRTVRRWESGDRDIPGPADVLMQWLLDGEPPDLENRKVAIVERI